MNNNYSNISNISNLTEEEIKSLTENLDAVYIYLDLYIDNMNADEINNWKQILEYIENLKINLSQ